MRKNRTPSELGRASKRKGGRFEREVKDFLNEITGGKWRRTPGSGSIRQHFGGDLMKDDQVQTKLDSFLIEAKDRKNLSIPQWIREAEDEALDAGKPNWIVIFKFQGKKYFLLGEKQIKTLL